MDNSNFEEIEKFLNSIKRDVGSWDKVAEIIPISRRAIFYYKKNKLISKNKLRLLQSMSKMYIRKRYSFWHTNSGETVTYERWHPHEILIRLDRFKQKVGTWKEVADQLEMPRGSLIRCKATGRMSETTGRLLDILLTAKGFRVDTQYLPKKSV